MYKKIYNQEWVGMASETVRNTAELVPTAKLPIQKGMLTLMKESSETTMMNGDKHAIQNIRFTKRKVEGKPTLLLDFENIGMLLKAAIGTPVTTTVDGAKIHTFRHQNVVNGTRTAEMPTFTVFQTLADKFFKYSGVSVDNMDITIDAENSTAEFEVIGLDEEEVTDATQKTNIMNVFGGVDQVWTPANFGNVVIEYADTYENLIAGTNVKIFKAIETIKLSFGNKLESLTMTDNIHRSEATIRDNLSTGFINKVSLAGTEEDNQDIKNAFKSGNPIDNQIAMRITILNPYMTDIVGATGTGALDKKPMMQLIYPKVLPVIEQSGDGESIEAISVEIENSMKSITGVAPYMILRNGVAGY